MKGTITKCLAQLVRSRGGEAAWRSIVSDANGGAELLEFISADVDDAVVVRLLTSTCKILRLDEEALFDAFGEYWCCTYAPDVYPSMMSRFKNARAMIVGMDAVHVAVTSTMANARPPRFAYSWKDAKTLLVRYTSSRNMVNLYVGLVRGVGIHYQESLRVTKLSETDVEIVFP
jgi:hypothetical protein